jgi:hypothetical protein
VLHAGGHGASAARLVQCKRALHRMPTIPPVHRWHPPCGWRMPPAPAAVHPRPATLAAAALAATALAAVRAAVRATANLTALTATSGTRGRVPPLHAGERIGSTF